MAAHCIGGRAFHPAVFDSGRRFLIPFQTSEPPSGLEPELRG